MSHDILSELYEVDRFLTKIRVDKKSFCKAMDLVGLVLKGTQMGKVFALEYKDKILTVRATASLYTEIEIDVVEHIDHEFEVVCAYSDTTSLLSSDQTIGLVVSSEYVTAESEGANISYRTSVASITKLNKDSYTPLDINVATLLYGLKRLTSLTTVLKVFPSYSVISLKDDTMQLRTPSMWFEVPSSKLNMTMDVSIARVINAYTNETNDYIEITQSLNYITITSGSASLFIPKQDEASILPFSEVTQSYTFAGNVNISRSLTKVKDLVRVAPATDVTISIAEEGLRIVSDTNDHRVDLVVGEVDKHIVTFETRLEFLQQILTLVGTQFTVGVSGDLVHLKGPSAGVLLSTV